MRRNILLGVVALAAAGCGSSAVGQLRFKNQPPVWRVNDRNPIAEPGKRQYNRTLYHVDGYVLRPVTRWMDFKPSGRALDINSVEEVPDSTWFTNRIGVRELTIDELRRGPNSPDSPFQHRPWTIKSAKIGGLSLGFIFEDARGDKFLVKFDGAKFPEMETAAHVIAHRILWACGFNVPEDYLGTIRREDLKIAPDAKQKNPEGKEVKLTEADLDTALRTVAKEGDGTIRVLASKFTRGKPVGPYAREGTRGDDPNDVIPHERRRSIRGQYPIFAWLNHTDLQEDNTLDSYEPDPADPSRKYVRHYLIDFGKSLGVMGATNKFHTIGYTHRVDVEYAVRALLGFGLWMQPWDGVREPGLRGVGLFESMTYDPAIWRTNSTYWPYVDKDRFDAFWGAKILIRFTPEQLAAVVEEAKYSDPRAAAYMLRTLIDRQRKTARYWFQRVAPIDEIGVTPRGDGHEVCFDDLTLRYRLETVEGVTRYRVQAYDWDGKPTAYATVLRPGKRGRTCMTGVTPAPGRDGYTILRIELVRGTITAPPVLVHLARAPTGELRLVGLRRK